MHHLLIEIGVEELPARWLFSLEKQFATCLCAVIKQNNIAINSHSTFATPRRLAVLLELPQTMQDNVVETKYGPSVAVAFDADNNPTPACTGFAKSCGVSVDELSTTEENNKQRLVFKHQKTGKPILEIIAGLIEQALDSMKLPASMHWDNLASGKELSFVRPIRWITCLLDDKSPASGASVWELPIFNHSYGHASHHPQAVEFGTAADYQETLKQAFVLVDAKQRKDLIKQDIIKIATSLQYEAVIEEHLLNEVTALVEWPVVLQAEFSSKYIELPKEVITTTLTANQKYFHMLDSSGNLATKFLIVANIKDSDANVIKGNERVVVPRLDDARFFVMQDKQMTLGTMQEKLPSMQYVKNLGNLAQKQQRIEKIALWLTDNSGKKTTSNLIQRAAFLCKADLVSNLVGEFPSLQGIAGSFYAKETEEEAVTTAIRSHYQPKTTANSIPNDTLGWLLALADRVDLVVGLFGLGLSPAGDKDPFGLRRAMNGIIRLLEHENTNIKDLFACANSQYEAQNIKLTNVDLVADLQIFCLERMPQIFKHIDATAIKAVIAIKPVSIADTSARMEALHKFVQNKNYAEIYQLYKRLHNILKKASINGVELKAEMLVEEQEQNLLTTAKDATAKHSEYFAKQNYLMALNQLSSLEVPLTDFFAKVMVNADDVAIKNNRLALLNFVYQLFVGIVDFSYLPTTQ